MAMINTNRPNFWDSVKAGADKVAKLIGTAMDSTVEHFESQDKFFNILKEMGWPPPHEAFLLANMSVLSDWIASHDSGDEAALSALIEGRLIEWHDEAILYLIVESWREKPWLNERMSILEDAVNAHIEGRYNLSVPALVPQVEGVIADNFRIIGSAGTKRTTKVVSSLLHPALVVHNKAPALQQFFSNSFLKNFVRGKSDVSIVNRHAIAHGADTTYGTVQNSLRIILLLDALIKLLRLVSIKDSKLFHLNGCSIVEDSEGERIFYSTLPEADRAGLDACSKCLKGFDLSLFF